MYCDAVTNSYFIYLRLLLSVEGIGPIKLRNLLSAFPDQETILKSTISELIKVEGISSDLAKRIKKAFKESDVFEDKIRKELNQLEEMGARYITYWDDEYPSILKKIYDPPIILYLLGSFVEDDANAVALVGTRMPTQYGKHVATQLSQDLAKASITVVSGLARGVDTVAHKGALHAGGRTIAVLGSGFDIMYPSENKGLSDEIRERGVVVSEYPLGTLPDAQNFPKRNRIISGLSKGVVVIESAFTGGAMLTAKLALDQGREVFAVPGNIGVRQSEGTLALIQRGEAKLTTKVDDILVEIGMSRSKQISNSAKDKIVNDLNLFEQKLYQTLSDEPVQIDTISTLTSLSISDCLVYLLSLEFKGLIRQLPGKMFVVE